jgi:hypothetical protein
MNWRALPWNRIGAIALAAGAWALGTFVPVTAPIAFTAVPALLGVALPSEWVGKVLPFLPKPKG